MHTPKLLRKLVVEFIGSGCFLTVAITSAQVIPAEHFMQTIVATVGCLGCMIAVCLPISGAHFNPAVSLTAFLLGHMRFWHMVAYICVQLLASVVGASICLGILHHPGQLASLGVSDEVHLAQAFFCEVMATFFIVMTVIALGLEHRNPRTGRLEPHPHMPFYVMWVVAGDMALALRISGAGMNPARTFGPLLLRGGFPHRGEWIYFVAPMLASVFASIGWRFIWKPIVGSGPSEPVYETKKADRQLGQSYGGSQDQDGQALPVVSSNEHTSLLGRVKGVDYS